MQAAAAYHGTTSHRPNGTCRRQRRTVEVQVILKGNVMRIGETLVAAQWVFALVPSGHKTSHQLESLLHRRQLWRLRWQSSGEAPEASGRLSLCKGILFLNKKVKASSMAATKVFPKIGSSKLMQRHPRIAIVTSKHAKYNLQIPGLVGGLGWEARFRLLAPSFDSVWMPLFVKAWGRKRTFDSSGSLRREARFRLFGPRGILRNPTFDFAYWGKP